MLRRIAIVLVLALLVVLPATAQDYQRAEAAFKRGDYAVALEQIRPLAEQGHALAQYSLGFMYAKGHGVPQDYVLAHMWFSLSAAKGHKDGPKARDIVATRMTRTQTAKAQKLAREWRAKHPKKK